jgi:hypothetical protein
MDPFVVLMVREAQKHTDPGLDEDLHTDLREGCVSGIRTTLN